MRRKIKPIDVNELIDADDINRTSIKGEMRKLWSAIHQKLSECGWTARDMVKWLDERGVSMSVELFRVYLNEIDKENKYDRSKNKFYEVNNISTRIATKETTPKLSTDESHTPTSSTYNKSKNAHDSAVLDEIQGVELVRPPGITNSAWTEKQQKHKTALRRLKQGEIQ